MFANKVLARQHVLSKHLHNKQTKQDYIRKKGKEGREEGGEGGRISCPVQGAGHSQHDKIQQADLHCQLLTS